MRTEEMTEGVETEKQELEELESEDYKKIPPWSKQITTRGLVSGFLIGVVYSVIVMKLSLSTGLVPPLNCSAALLAFVVLKSWTTLLEKVGFMSTPFTRQENTVVQTCAVACYSLSQGGGFGSYLLALSKKIYVEAGVNLEGNTPDSYKEPGIGWMTAYLFIGSFVGLLVLVPLRKIMVIDYKLAYPNGFSSAVLINGFHTPKEDKIAKKQIRGFVKFFSISFLWGFFKWFYGEGGGCGFSQFPTFGLKSRKQTFYFDFNVTYIGAGMICTHLVNLSLLLGAVLSWGIMWPLIGHQKGHWYPSDLSESSMRSLQGYKVFIAIALILGDGLYNFMKTLSFTIRNIRSGLKNKNNKTGTDLTDFPSIDHRRNESFMKDSIPVWLACSSYTIFAIISIAVMPRMFPQMKWYYVLLAYIFAPSLGFCNAYGMGLTNMNMAYNYGKVALFVFAAWAGKDHGGVVAGLVSCGLVKMVVSISADLMQDFKTSHLTFTSPRSMLLSQIIGTAMGCIIAPLTFFVFYKAFDVGNPNGEFKAPYGLIYRNMAILGVEGFSALPGHCLQLCCGFFCFALAVNFTRDFSPERFGRWAPLPMAMAVPFLVGAFFAIDMFVGTLIVFAWHKIDSKKASSMVPAVASGLISGDGLWIVPSSILALAKVKPPICMKFVSN